ncbi:hypothetical protein ACLOJK_019484 [Asimina triloba]
MSLLEMGWCVNRGEALQEEAEGAILELRSVLDTTRAKLDEACDDAKGVSFANVKASLLCLSDQVEHAWKEMSRLSSELGAVRAERDEAIGSAGATKEEALRFSTQLVTLRFKAEALRVGSADPDIDEESSHAELEAMRGEVVILGSRELELLAESEAAQTEVARLRAELETLWADLEHLQAASSRGGASFSHPRAGIKSGREKERGSPCASEVKDWFTLLFNLTPLPSLYP